MEEDMDTESLDLIEKIDSIEEEDEVASETASIGSQHSDIEEASHSDPFISEELTHGYLTLKNVQFSRPPARDICSLAVSTFEKMDLTNLRQLEKLSEDLSARGQIGVEELKAFTMSIMTEVWQCDEQLSALLKSDPQLTQTLGRELLVLFDNVMSDPVYEITKTGKPQRYTKACLDNSIQPIYDENVPENRWSTYETVISTYTSPTAFTPEMESLMKTAARLGISTNDLNLKKFVTERSLSAFLKTLIQAKLKKKSFIKKFNSKLLGVLHHMPNPEESGVMNKFKYSFSKLCRFVDPKTKSSPDIRNTFRQFTNSRSDRSKYSIHKKEVGGASKSGRLKFQKGKKYDPADTICNKCHEPYREDCMGDRSLLKSMSDSCLSLATCESITGCQCFDNAKKVWDKRQTPAERQNPSLLAPDRKKRSSLKSSLRPMNDFQANVQGDHEGFGLLTEQRSFFRLGEGALRDALSEYVETKNIPTNNNKKAPVKKKRVRWLDETSFSTIYGSLTDSTSELMLINERTSIHDYPEAENIAGRVLYYLLQDSAARDSRSVELFEKPLRRVFVKALVQATLVAFMLWFCFVLYVKTPEIAEKMRQLIFSSWLNDLKTGPVL